MTHRLLIAVAAISLAGCIPPVQDSSVNQPKGYLKFEQPKMPPVPPRVATPIDASLQQKARDEITLAFNSGDEVTRAQSLEACTRTNDPAAAQRVARGLNDKAWLVRFAAAMCAGDLKLAATRQPLLVAADDANPNVRVGVRYALHRLGDSSRTKDLEAMSQDPDPRVRANVAVVLGLLREPTAVRVLRPMLTDVDFAVRMQASESLWRLGDEQGLKNLIAASVSQFPDDQILSVLGLAGPRDQRVRANVAGKLAIPKDGEAYVELQLAAARALGTLGDDSGYGVAVGQVTSRDPRQRALAALALGEIGRPDAQPALAKLLADPMPPVRLAAAQAIRQVGAAKPS